MEDAPPPPKKSTTLSVDRAAFLLLRVKKAFKKKRQQRKEKQTQATGTALIAQTRPGRKVPPPLLRSRTLPAIIVPGIPVVSLHTTDRQFQFDERHVLGTKSGSSSSTCGSNRWSLLTRNTPTTPGCVGSNYSKNNNTVSIKSLNLPKDDIGVYRRKSSGSTSTGTGTGTSTGSANVNTSIGGAPISVAQVADAALLMPTCEDFECHAADGSVLLRIPAPHVVAARAYRLAAKKRATAGTSTTGSGGSSGATYEHSQQTSTTTAGSAAASARDTGNTSEGQHQHTTLDGLGVGGGSDGGASSGSGAGNTALTRRLAKLLHQSSISASKLTSSAAASAHSDNATLLPIMAATASGDGASHIGVGGADDAPRRLSWERRKDSSALQRSASIDSFAEIVWSDSPRPSLDIPRPPVVPFSKRPSASSLFSNCSNSSQNTQLNINYGATADLCSSGSSAGNSRRESLLSPSSTRRNKLTRIINGDSNRSHKNLQIGGCLRAPGALLRQKSFHTLSELGRLCQTSSNAATTPKAKKKRNKQSTASTLDDDNILPQTNSLTLDRATWRAARAKVAVDTFAADAVADCHVCDYVVDNDNACNEYADNDDDAADVVGDDNDDDESSVVLRRTNSAYNKRSSNNSYNNNNNNNSHNNNNNRNNNNNNEYTKCSKIRQSDNATQQRRQQQTQQRGTLRVDLRAGAGAGVGAGAVDDVDAEIADDAVLVDANATFRWSEQWTHNVAVAKIRTAISCTSHDLKELETLLPQAAAANATTTTTSTRMTATMPFGAASNQLKSAAMLSATTEASGLSVARHARNISNAANVVTTASSNSGAHHANSLPNPKQAKLNGINASATTDASKANQANLAIYRHSASARLKLSNGDGAGASVAVAGTPYRSKMSKKQLKLAQAQLDKLNQINLHLHALFSAVEHAHLEKARTILESTDVDVNSINTDGLSALDVAVLSNNRSMTKMLLQHGAIEGTQFSADNVGSKLNGLLKDAESRIQDLSGLSDGGLCQPTFTSRPSISSIIIGNTGSSVTGCTGNEIDKQIGIWERRVKGLRRLLLGWDQARPPDAPASVTVDVTGENTIALQILEPFEGAIGTKFQVQWSTRADFSNVVGERELVDWTSFHGSMGSQCHVGGLTQGRRYFIRAACGNFKGWGPYKTSVPASVVPSSWRDFNNREDRYVGRQRVLDNLFTAVRLARPADVSELTLDVNTSQRRNPKKKTTIKQLFSVASKFQKHLRRGIYLASIVYCEDKVLVTSEDFLPVIEIDESYPGSLHSDYHWLMKIACTWDDVKSLRTDMERNLTSAVHFRTKLLSAVCQMQSALGLTDLGQLFYKPLRDSHGTVVLTCIQSVKSQKTISILNSRWLPINKLQKKIVALLEDYNISDMLISSISEQIHYHQASMQRLSAGLYLGYLKMQCSMEQIQVVVPMKTPNVLPHCKVRDNSHITADEWQILKRGSGGGDGGARSNSPLNMALELSTNAEDTTEAQRLFLYDLTNAAHKLFSYMNIKPHDAATHRLYDVEVIEHSKDISFLLICPAVELTCAVPGQSELLLQRDDLASLSIQAFEMIHLRTYQPGIIQKYARLSCILELDTALANHSQREAFSTSEMQTAKERLAKLHELSANLNAVWKSVRWLMDVIAFARDKNAQSSVAMKEILEFGNPSNETGSDSGSVGEKQLLQLPTRDAKYTKSSGRGSWPGPGANTQSGSNACLAAEHSKSEQNLGRSATTPTSSVNLVPSHQKKTGMQSGSELGKAGAQQLLQVGMPYDTSDASMRKNSGDSMTSSQYTTRSYYSGADSALSSSNELGQIFAIPPSRSDDTLAMASLDTAKHAHATATHRTRTTSNIAQQVTTPTPLGASTGSSSAPYLARDLPSSSNLSMKNASSSDYDIKSSKAASQTTDTTSITSTIGGKVKAASSANLRDGSLYLKTALTDTKVAASKEMPAAAAPSIKASSVKNLTRHSSEEDTASGSSGLTVEQTAAPASGIIHVYTAYNTGLASGTSLKLHVTPKTSAREVINLVVKQLNMAAVLKGNNGPIYTGDMLDNFCLVAVIGARERCLRDDFKPLQLQNPWRKGRLYVRQKHELLAAIEHANRKAHLN